MSHDNVVMDYLTSLAEEVSLEMPDFADVADLAHDAMRRASLGGADERNKLQRDIAVYILRRDLCVAFWHELIPQTRGGMYRYWPDDFSEDPRVYFSAMAVMLFRAGCIELEPRLLHTYLNGKELDRVSMQVAGYPGVMQRLDPDARETALDLLEHYGVSFEAVGWPPMVKSEPLKGE